MSLLWSYIKNYKKVLFLALGLATINQVFSLLDPQLFRLIIDNYATKVGQLPQSDFVKGVGLLLLGTVAVAFISRVAKNFQDYYVNVITEKVGAEMYNHAIEHSFSLPFSVFEDQRSGELLELLKKARQSSRGLMSQVINTVFFSLIGVIFVVVYAFFVQWLLGLIYSLLLPTIGVATYFITRKIKAIQKVIVAQTASLSGSTTETLRNIELVKSMGLEAQEVTRLNKVNDEILRLELNKVVLVRKLSFIQGTIINAIRSGLVMFMLWEIFVGQITLGEFFTLTSYSFFVFGPLSELGYVANSYQETKASMEQLDQVLKQQPEQKPQHPLYFSKIHTLALENVVFAYQSASLPALSNISFRLEQGQSMALVGPSGSGKTSVIKLLVGLYSPTQGQVLINENSLEQLDKSIYRNRIGFVSQDTQLFAGTIRENLLFVKPLATDQECQQALNDASALPIIQRGDKGLDTKIGEGGLKLSGGEKQRLAIARALLRQPDIIIFDEATSSLDSITEQEITDTIKRIKQTRPELMTILVAHRLSTVVHADTIYVLEKGRIVETGSHQSLLANTTGLYSALWRQQTAEKNQ